MVCGWGEDTLPIMSSTGDSQQLINTTNDVSLETINLLGTLFASVAYGASSVVVCFPCPRVCRES